MLQPRVTAAKGSDRHLVLLVANGFTEVQPKYPLGLFVPLGKIWQCDDGVTHYGRIQGIEWDGDTWIYHVHPPKWHPVWDEVDVLLEQELEDRLEFRDTSKSPTYL